MVNDLPIQYWNDEIERNAYNAAFYELGFRWYWDGHTYYELLSLSRDVDERICHYLKTRQPHLLRAYEAAFLVEVIRQKQAEHKQRAAAPGAMTSGYFDWAATPGRHSLSVRATDGSGSLQPEDRAEPFPDGATGWHTVVVTVS